MSTTALTNTNISQTYKGLLHAGGVKIPTSGGIVGIYDGAGQQTSLSLGLINQGISVTGGITTTGSVLLYSTDQFTYPRIQFGLSDNTDPMYITRVNSETDRSELRVNIGDNVGSLRASDSFIIGGTTSSRSDLGFRPILSLSGGNGNMVVQLPAHTTPYVKPPSWGGGITSFDFYSDGGTFGAGRGGTIEASMNRDGVFRGKMFVSTSSKDHKTNIKPLENALDIINKLDGVRFDWKDTGKTDIGLIAEDVNNILPELVIKDEETGKPQGIDYGKITAVLIEAVKELTKFVTK